MSKIKQINYQIETDNISKKIILLSDIHYYSSKEEKALNRVLDILNTMEYDYLCIAGDLLDFSIVLDEHILLKWLTELGKKSRVIISIGNHDITNERRKHEHNFNKPLFDKIRKIKNVTVLDNEICVIGNIRFVGMTLPVDYYYKFKESRTYFMRHVNNIFPTPFEDSKYNILLLHTPLPVTDNETLSKTRFMSGIDLILSGHTHGGLTPRILWRLFKGRGLIGPLKDIFPKNAYGLIENKKNKVIISSGVMTASHSNRFSFTDPLFMKEITIVNLVKKVK
jgi:predicted MPP superfamily phosphohydrolase